MKRKALVFGGTGLTGTALIAQLNQDERYDEVLMFVRKKVDISWSKVTQVQIDFDKMDDFTSLIQGDDLFICLGSTIGKAGSKAAFYKIDHDYVIQSAQCAARGGAKRAAVITSIGANSKSMFFYPKVKGIVEQELKQIGFESLYILRPSLLLGTRKEFRFGERIFVVLSENFPWIYFGPFHKYRPIHASVVAKSMVQLLNSGDQGARTLESEEIQAIGK